MRNTNAHKSVVITTLFLVVASFATSVWAQESRDRIFGACCAGLDDCRHMTESKCLSLGEEATWTAAYNCEEIMCGPCVHARDLTCRYTFEKMCMDTNDIFCADISCGECIERARPDDDDDSACMMHRLFQNDFGVISDMATFHQFQNRIVVESEKGREMKALFHEHMTELGLILLWNPDLKRRGMELLEVAAPGFRNLLDESAGEELVLTTGTVQTINDFLSDVGEHASPEAQSALDQVKAEFDAVEGMSLREIRVSVMTAEQGED